mgnify:CR=1 FL=1
MTKRPSLPAIFGRDGCSESSTNRPISVQRKSGSICHCLLTEMPPAAMALPRVSLLTCALRGIFSPRVHILPSHEKTSQWWTLVPASDGHVTCFGVSLRSQCRSRGALHPIHF